MLKISYEHRQSCTRNSLSTGTVLPSSASCASCLTSDRVSSCRTSYILGRICGAGALVATGTLCARYLSCCTQKPCTNTSHIKSVQVILYSSHPIERKRWAPHISSERQWIQVKTNSRQLRLTRYTHRERKSGYEVVRDNGYKSKQTADS